MGRFDIGKAKMVYYGSSGKGSGNKATKTERMEGREEPMSDSIEIGHRQAQVARVVLEVVQRNAAIQSVPQRDMSLYDDLGFDVIDIAVNLVVEIEEQIGEDLDFDIDKVETVGDLIDAIQGCIESKA